MNQPSTIPYPEWSKLAKLSQKFLLGLEELKRKSPINTKTKVASKIDLYLRENHNLTTTFDSSDVTNFSKIFKINPKEENVGKEGILLLVLEHLDFRILHECELEWNGRSYIKTKELQGLPKYEALAGAYFGYTLDLEAPGTDLKNDIFWVHRFKIKVESKKIKLFTKNAAFESTEIQMITNGKLFFKIVNEDKSRTVWFTVLLEDRGPTEIKAKSMFKSGYLDSGATKMKIGRAILERITLEAFESLSSQSKSIFKTELKDSPIGIHLEYLKGSQIIVD